MKQYAIEFINILKRYKNITVVSHINPDADTIGTALGLYTWLREQGFQVEVVNLSADIPIRLDYIANFSKIKNRIDFDNSLIISCDCASIDRVGFDMNGRDIVNIDHHMSNTGFGILNIVNDKAVCTSEVAYNLIKEIYPISKDTAVGFYAALISDTQNFTTTNVSGGTFRLASEFVRLGADVEKANKNITLRRSLAYIRILSLALDSIELRYDAKVAIMKITQADMHKTGAKISDTDGLIDYAKSLTTVDIALFFMEQKDAIKVSMRSKDIDISEFSSSFGGGGHRLAGGFSIKGADIETLSIKVLDEIKKRGLII